MGKGRKLELLPGPSHRRLVTCYAWWPALSIPSRESGTSARCPSAMPASTSSCGPLQRQA